MLSYSLCLCPSWLELPTDGAGGSAVLGDDGVELRNPSLDSRELLAEVRVLLPRLLSKPEKKLSLPAPPNYPLRNPKQSIRPFIKVHWQV